MTKRHLVEIDFVTIGNTAWNRTPIGSHVRSTIFLRQKLLDRARKKLIEELIRVGRLIDPAPGTGQRKGEDAVELPGITQQSDMDVRSHVVDLEGLPVVDEAVDPPYITKDMFAEPAGNHVSRLARPSEGQQPAANKSGSSNVPVSERGPVATDLDKQFNQKTIVTVLPVEELARELVTLIENRVSQRSGEQLDDTFRDELTQAVIAQLEGWLKYD